MSMCSPHQPLQEVTTILISLYMPKQYTVDSSGYLTWIWIVWVHLYVLSVAGSPQMCRANSMHSSMPFYIGDLSICGFWNLHVYVFMCVEGGARNNAPWILRENWSFGRAKRYTQIFNYTRVGAPNLHIVQGSTVLFLFACFLACFWAL